MKKLKIESVDNFNYFLVDSNNKSYEIIIEFHNLNVLPKKGDYIYIDEKLLEEKMLALGPIGSIYGKNANKNEEDVVVLFIGNTKIFLQRYYG